MSKYWMKNVKRGKKSPNWKGGKFVRNGYIYVYAPDNPHHHQKYYAEHRLVMEKKHGRFLEPREHVHHIDGSRNNNRVENLIVLSPSEHNKKHPEGKFEKGHKYHSHKTSK